jgi:hypothetical protein
MSKRSSGKIGSVKKLKNRGQQDGKRGTSRKLKTKSTGSSPKSTSLVSPSGMGGLIGGKGYNFQSRYIACHVPEWLLDGSFTAILPEGTGDVDVLFGAGKKERREHIQIKDHPVGTKTEFREIVETFAAFDVDMPGVYQRFVVACPSLGPVIQPLKNALERVRDAGPFFKGARGSLKATITDVKRRIAGLGLAAYQDFIIEKVHFDIGLSDFHEDNAACNSFALKLLEHPEYKEKLIHLIKPAYTPLLQEVTSHQGKVLDRVTLKSLIDAALKTGGTEAEAAIDLDVHNWTVGKYDREPQYIIDWSKHFGRHTRILPSENVWNEKLVPEIYALKKRLAKKTSVRFIRLRGKSTLTTGILLGAAFPQIDDWIFEIPQPPKPIPWRSDAPPLMSYGLQVGDETLVNVDGDSIAFVFNIKGSALRDVEKNIKDHSLPVKAIVLVAPEGDARALSIADDREAVSVALIARDELRRALERHDVRVTHLFFYGPLALSVFVGQLLTSIGRVHLYEFRDPGYVPSATIRT